MEWISVTHKMPEERDMEAYEILTFGGWNNHEVCLFQDGKFLCKDTSDDDGNPKDITDYIEKWAYIEGV